MDARGQEDENPTTSDVAENMKLLANSFYGYQIMDRSRHTMTMYLTDEKTHSPIRSELLKRLNHITDQLYEVDLVKSEIEQREPSFLGFFVLQYAKLRKLEQYYNFFKKFCDVDKSEELEMNTDSLYLVLSEEKLEDVMFFKKRDEWDQLRTKDCTHNFTATATGIFFPRNCCNSHKNMIRANLDYLKKNSGVRKCCACVAEPIVATMERKTSTNSVARDSKKGLWKTVEMDPCQNIARCQKRQSTLL